MSRTCSPLETLATWYCFQPPEIQGRIAFESFRLRGLKLHAGVISEYRVWLDHVLPAREHCGRALVACALIDFQMLEYGSIEAWDEVMRVQLDLIEREVPSDIRALLNRQLGEHSARRSQWLMAARGWQTLRSQELHHDCIRQWMLGQIKEGDGSSKSTGETF